MTAKDRLGFNFEMKILKELKKARLSKYIVYANPKNFKQWKKKISHGVDLVLKIGENYLYTEDSYCSKPYTYRSYWFKDSRVKRFNGYPLDKQHEHIVLTNHLSNFWRVKQYARTFFVDILDINQLISYVKLLVHYYNIDNYTIDYNTIMHIPNMIETIKQVEQAIRDMDLTKIEKKLMKNG